MCEKSDAINLIYILSMTIIYYADELQLERNNQPQMYLKSLNCCTVELI